MKLKPAHLFTLYRLAELGALRSEIACSTGQLASMLGTSQQTASRYLIQLEEQGLVSRAHGARERTLRVTEKGASQLSDFYRGLERALESQPREIRIEGTVFSGLEEGAWFMSRPGYRRQFIRKLSYDPFPGTLNIRVDKEFLDERRRLEGLTSIWIDGFQDAGRSFGPAKCYPAKVNGKIDCHVIVPVRTHYSEDVIELIAPKMLRRLLSLKDGEPVTVQILQS